MIKDLVDYTKDAVSYYVCITSQNLPSNKATNRDDKIYRDTGAQVCDGIFIGSLATAMNKEILLKYDIGAIVNLSGFNYQSNIPVTEIRMDDVAVTINNLNFYLTNFRAGCEVISTARSAGKNVLVHCAAGINRSATQIAFYLISIGSNYEMAYKLLSKANKKRHVPLLTNSSFRYLLQIHSNIKNKIAANS